MIGKINERSVVAVHQRYLSPRLKLEKFIKGEQTKQRGDGTKRQKLLQTGQMPANCYHLSTFKYFHVGAAVRCRANLMNGASTKRKINDDAE